MLGQNFHRARVLRILYSTPKMTITLKDEGHCCQPLYTLVLGRYLYTIHAVLSERKSGENQRDFSGHMSP